jgi:hypothetical protein
MTTEVARELEERNILFAYRIDNADGAAGGASHAENSAARSSKLSLKRRNPIGGRVKMLLVKLLQNVHVVSSRNARVLFKDNAAQWTS